MYKLESTAHLYSPRAPLQPATKLSQACSTMRYAFPPTREMSDDCTASPCDVTAWVAAGLSSGTPTAEAVHCGEMDICLLYMESTACVP